MYVGADPVHQRIHRRIVSEKFEGAITRQHHIESAGLSIAHFREFGQGPECFVGQVLRILDNQNRALAGGCLLQREHPQHREQLSLGAEVYVVAELPQCRFEETHRGQVRAIDDSESAIFVQIFRKMSQQRGLAAKWWSLQQRNAGRSAAGFAECEEGLVAGAIRYHRNGRAVCAERLLGQTSCGQLHILELAPVYRRNTRFF